MKQNCTIEVEKCTISYKGIKLGELFTITTKIKKYITLQNTILNCGQSNVLLK